MSERIITLFFNRLFHAFCYLSKDFLYKTRKRKQKVHESKKWYILAMYHFLFKRTINYCKNACFITSIHHFLLSNFLCQQSLISYGFMSKRTTFYKATRSKVRSKDQSPTITYLRHSYNLVNHCRFDVM